MACGHHISPALITNDGPYYNNCANLVRRYATLISSACFGRKKNHARSHAVLTLASKPMAMFPSVILDILQVVAYLVNAKCYHN